MKPGERLIWELFEFVRELMPASEANTRRLSEWATRFHMMERGEAPLEETELPSAEDTDQADSGDDEAEDDHPIGHARRAQGKRKR